MIHVIDLEATCWEDRPHDALSDIIEIGLATLHADGQITRAPRMLIRPERSEISPFCTQLTGITPEDVMNAPTLAEVAEQLRSSGVPNHPWISWGHYDRNMIQQSCEILGVPAFVSNQHLNIKLEHARRRNLKRGIGLNRAMAYERLTMEGRHHQGDDDAYNIARIAALLQAQAPLFPLTTE